MQTLTRTMEEAIRSSYQAPIAKLEIYNQDGSLAGVINDVEKIDVNVSSSRKVLRTFKASINNDEGKYTPDPDQFERNFLWYNKTVKVFYGYTTTEGEEWLSQGKYTLDYIKPSIKVDGITLEIGGQDLINKMIEDKFDDIYTVQEGDVIESANHALLSGGASALSSSFVQAGDEIQTQARIHYVDYFATINGVKQKVENENVDSSKDPQRLINGLSQMLSDSFLMGSGMVYDDPDGEFMFLYNSGNETISEVEMEIFADLQSTENIQEININLLDGELTDFVYLSPDNAAWYSYTETLINPSHPVRFIKFKVRKTASNDENYWSLSIGEIKIKTAENFRAALSIDGDVYGSHWRPKALTQDPDPYIVVDMGSEKNLNVLYLYWGNNSFDLWNRCKYFLESSTDGSSWSRITDLNGLDETVSLFGDVEHCFDPISCRYIKLNIKDKDGITKLRHIKAQSISAIETVDKVIRDVAASSGITETKIPITRKYVTKKQAEIGDEKIHFCNLLAGSLGWRDLHMDEDGCLKTGPRVINPVDLAWTFSVETDNIFSFSPRFSNDIYNVIIVVGKGSSERAIVGRASDDNPLSPTFTGTLGRRVKKYEGESYNTQDKADQYAQQKLFERTRFKHQTSLPVTAHPGLQPDDVVKVTVKEAKVEDQLYLITGFVTKFNAATAEFDSTVNISQL